MSLFGVATCKKMRRSQLPTLVIDLDNGRWQTMIDDRRIGQPLAVRNSVRASAAIAAASGAQVLLQRRADRDAPPATVTSNFTEPADAIAAWFKGKVRYDVVVSFDTSGQFHSQFTHAARFSVKLSKMSHFRETITEMNL